MPANIYTYPYDLTSTDGYIIDIQKKSSHEVDVIVLMENISPLFKGFEIDKELVHFNIKSTFAQLGVDGVGISYEFAQKFNKVTVHVQLKAFTPIGAKLLSFIDKGMYIGKLFAADDRRRVRHPSYFTRLLGKTDSEGYPLLILSQEYKNEKIIEQKEKNRTIVRVPLLPGYWVYDEAVEGFLATVAKGLKNKETSFRKFLFLHQKHVPGPRKIQKESILLVRTITMYIRTLFAKVVNEELPKGFRHASADIICPQRITGDIFEFHGASDEEICDIPLEFYTLESYREFFFFSDRDLLCDCLEKPELVFKAYDTIPSPRSAVFVAKGEDLLNLKTSHWIKSDPPPIQNPVLPAENRKQKEVLKHFTESLALHTILKAMQEGNITSQGIILTDFAPSPILKHFLLSEQVRRSLKAIYFRTPSQKYGDFFSSDDRNMLQDLAKASVDVFWVDFRSHLLLKYILRSDKDSGMFVPIDKEKEFRNATFFGVYGSRMQESLYYKEIIELFKGLLAMKQDVDHDKLNAEVSLAITTGGGPGVMSMGNKIANELGILSCGHAVDFTKPHENPFERQEMNPYIQAKMTYRLEQLIVRQSEFMLDFPIFFEGGIGTDFEYALELLLTQVGSRPATPILLFGDPSYWKAKITNTFHINRQMGTIHGSEWVSNTLYCVNNHKEALLVYYKYFTHRLQIGRDFPASDDGFVTVDSSF